MQTATKVHTYKMDRLSCSTCGENYFQIQNGASEYNFCDDCVKFLVQAKNDKGMPDTVTEKHAETETNKNSDDGSPIRNFDEARQGSTSRSVRKYYKRQMKLLKHFDKDVVATSSFIEKHYGPGFVPISSDDLILSEPNKEKSGRTDVQRAKLLATMTLGLNICLLLMKLTATLLSGSLSIVSSLVDSGVDITSGFVIWVTSRAIKHRNRYAYPRGRTRLEPLALIIISVIMAVASVQVIVKSIEKMSIGDPGDTTIDNKTGLSRSVMILEQVTPDVGLITIGLMVATILTKSVMMIVCLKYRHTSPSISMLAMDHRNDCISNSVAIICAYLSVYLSQHAHPRWVYLDPIGAIIVSIYIGASWFITGYEQTTVLSGKTAEVMFINRIIKLAMEHDIRIKYVDTIMAYHFGTKFLVELDIVLDGEMKLREAHDLSEPLQRKIEHLPEVERCFLHLDYEFDHKMEDEHKVV